jgi:hypothetical protein
MNAAVRLRTEAVVAEPKLSRFEFGEALTRAMRTQDEVAKRLDDVSPRALWQALFDDLGLDVDAEQLAVRVEPRGKFIGATLGRQLAARAIAAGEPIDLTTSMATAWVSGCLDGVALGLHIAQAADGGS